jgi:hypothetical protein
MGNRSRAIIAAAAIAIVAGATFKVYLIRDDTGGDVLWNADGAHFFVWVFHRGLRVSYL